MTASEKFCLKWNDFQINVTNSFKDIREDFCDVTLVGEGNMKIEAHKVILSASSSFFYDILKQNPHSNPLLYMRGIKHDQLSAVMDFMYHGEANVAQEDIDGFLKVAEELQLKGLTNSEEFDNYSNKEVKSNVNTKQRKQAVFQTSSSVQFVPKVTMKKEMIQTQETNMMDTVGDLTSCDVTETVVATSCDQLNETINSMMQKVEGTWSCIKCGKSDKDKSNMRNHIEGKHIEGVSHPCNQCGKQFRSRNSLTNHISVNHKHIRA